MKESKNYYNKLFLALILDGIVGLVSLYLAYWLRLNDIITSWEEILCAIFCTPITFYFLGVYRRSWRYTSTSDIWHLIRVNIAAVIFLFISLFIINRLENLPRLVLVINYFISITLTCGSRFIYRSFLEYMPFLNSDSIRKIPIVLIGNRDNADSFIRAAHKPNGSYQVIGLIEQRKLNKERNLIRGVPVLGHLNDAESILTKLTKSDVVPERLVIVSNNLEGESVELLLKISDRKGIKIGRAPRPDEIIEGHNVTELKEINLFDLLGRRQNRLDKASMKNLIGDKIILVTGAGGTIGSELVKRIKEFHPKKLVLVDSSEYALYNLKLSLVGFLQKIEVIFSCANVRDKFEVDKVFSENKPDLILHAAALKHVSICEDNILEAFKTNTLGTEVIADAALKYKCLAMVLISTDKAVEPTGVMGATKRLAEMIVQSKDKELKKTNITRFITVRFGNVLGSNGSVVPLFQKQLSTGGPITVTDKKATRFFMTVPEAVDLVLTVTSEELFKANKERGTINVLEMGRPMKIDHMARQMIKLAGLVPDEDIKIIYTGLTKGEKLHEKLFNSFEVRITTSNEGILLALSKDKEFNEISDKLKILKNYYDKSDIKNLRKELINFN